MTYVRMNDDEVTGYGIKGGSSKIRRLCALPLLDPSPS